MLLQAAIHCMLLMYIMGAQYTAHKGSVHWPEFVDELTAPSS